MTSRSLKQWLTDFKKGRASEEEVLGFLKDLPYQDLGFAKVDHHRGLRQGYPEVVFGRGKTNQQILEIAQALADKGPNLLITSAGRQVFEELDSRYSNCRFYPACEAVSLLREPPPPGRGRIGILSGGTADIPVAEEALATAEFMGNEVSTCYDVGVAGLHRILDQRKAIRECSVLIVAAGMEGALPSVVGGLVDTPVIAIPTSIGYGASFGGLGGATRNAE